MAFRFLFGLIIAATLGVASAMAQNTATPVITGYLSTSGCPSAALTPCFVQYGQGGSGPSSNVTITGPLGQALMAASIPVVIASNQSAVPVAVSAGSAIIGKVGIDQTTPGTTNGVVEVPPAVAPTVGASSAITSLVLKASATTATGGVKHFHAENATTTGGYCILYNGTAAPGTGSLTAANVLKFQLLPASGYCDWQANSTDPPVAASTGAVLLVSSGATPYTYTTGVITASMEGLAQ